MKWKALLVIKHICRSGRNDFKKDMARQTELIRDCLGFRGAPDPLLGDTIYKRVQEAAKEALDAIYDSEISSQGNQSGISSRIQGYGTTPIEPPQTNNMTKDASKIYSSVVSGVSKFVKKNTTNDNNGESSFNSYGNNSGSYNPNFQQSSYGGSNGYNPNNN